MRFAQNGDASVVALSVGKSVLVVERSTGTTDQGHTSRVIKTVHDDRIVGLAVAELDGQTAIFTAGWDKQLVAVAAKDGTVLHHRRMEKKPCVLCITKLDGIGSIVLVGQLNGEVTAYPLEDISSKDRKLLGHTSSMIMDMVVSPKRSHIITADKDQKIRVSRFPTSEIIESFCLGHTAFLNQVLVLQNADNLLVSGGADGTLRLWNWQTGQEVCAIDLPTPAVQPVNTEASHATHRIPIVQRIVEDQPSGLIAVCITDRPEVLFYEVTPEETLRHSGNLDSHAQPRTVWFANQEVIKLYVATIQGVYLFRLRKQGQNVELVSQETNSLSAAFSECFSSSDRNVDTLTQDDLDLEKYPAIPSIVLDELEQPTSTCEAADGTDTTKEKKRKV
eukprot:gb/GECG01005861.1/.p1 GENE.gb/GECG01005861.1/~~gb/GECG01005861.1/.p1  ORF type:complete len:391 (+),score=43.33 gb/GECG01005861.1/:1-1173(+)